jgi:hypothetical protein
VRRTMHTYAHFAIMRALIWMFDVDLPCFNAQFHM